MVCGGVLWWCLAVEVHGGVCSGVWWPVVFGSRGCGGGV